VKLVGPEGGGIEVGLKFEGASTEAEVEGLGANYNQAILCGEALGDTGHERVVVCCIVQGLAHKYNIKFLGEVFTQRLPAASNKGCLVP